jgi:hypothetical protein
MEIKEQIKALQSRLSGDLMNHCELHNEIYKLKQQLALEEGITIDQVDEQYDYICENCGS